MKKPRLLGAVCACILTLLTATTSAALIDNGGGLIYDDVLNITWAQPDVPRKLDDAKTWAAGLTLGGVSGWRLPYISVAAGAGPTHVKNTSANAMMTGPKETLPVVDCHTATELACRDNELGYMFYHNLGGTGGQSILTSGDPDLALFPALQSKQYWSGTEYGGLPAMHAFGFLYGNQSAVPSLGSFYSWAVHEGNVGGGGAAESGAPKDNSQVENTAPPEPIVEESVKTNENEKDELVYSKRDLLVQGIQTGMYLRDIDKILTSSGWKGQSDWSTGGAYVKKSGVNQKGIRIDYVSQSNPDDISNPKAYQINYQLSFNTNNFDANEIIEQFKTKYGKPDQETPTSLIYKSVTDVSGDVVKLCQDEIQKRNPNMMSLEASNKARKATNIGAWVVQGDSLIKEDCPGALSSFNAYKDSEFGMVLGVGVDKVRRTVNANMLEKGIQYETSRRINLEMERKKNAQPKAQMKDSDF